MRLIFGWQRRSRDRYSTSGEARASRIVRHLDGKYLIRERVEAGRSTRTDERGELLVAGAAIVALLAEARRR